MAKVIVEPDCENSSRMQFIRDLHIAFANRKTLDILKMISQDIIWDQVGLAVISGKDNFTEILKKLEKVDDLNKVRIMNIMSDGKVGAANGEIFLKNGDIYAFADIYTFTDAHDNEIKKCCHTILKYQIMNNQ